LENFKNIRPRKVFRFYLGRIVSRQSASYAKTAHGGMMSKWLHAAFSGAKLAKNAGRN
jgi:hypothetical protein